MPVFTAVTQAEIDSSPASLINAFFPTSAGITVDPASLLVTHGFDSISYYDGSLAALGIGSGLLLTSGTIPNITNTVPDFGLDNGMVGDADLDAVVNAVFATSSFDASTLSFNFNVTDPGVTGISFKVVFGTDEYPEWVDAFVDIGVVMVNGTNVAYFGNNPAAPLSVIGSNLASGYFIDNVGGQLPIEYDGVSNVLTVFAPVHQGLNTLKIGIADTGDHILDSGIFISGLTATSTPVTGVALDVPCTAGNDQTTGTVAAENINGLAGDDSLDGAGGDDVVAGGVGNDMLTGGAGNDYLDGGDGMDVAVFSGQASDYAVMALADGGYEVMDLSAGAPDGTDTVHNIETLQFADGAVAPGGLATGGAEIHGTAKDDIISLTQAPVLQPLATNLADTVWAGAGDDIIATGDGADVIHNGAGNDQASAGAGDDTIYVEGGHDQIDGGADVDTVVFSGAAADYSVVAGGDGWLVTDLRPGAPIAPTELMNVELLSFSDGTVTPGGAPPPPVNSAPTVSSPVTVAATEDGVAVSAEALANATDANGDPLSVTGLPAQLPAGVTFDANTKVFTLDPSNAAYQALAAGQQTAVVVDYAVSDGQATTPAQFAFTVTGVNDAPTLAQPLADALATAGAAFAYQAPAGAFADVDGDTLSLKAALADGSALPVWLAFDPASGGFNGAPTAAGAYDIQVTATDPGGLSISDVFHLSVAAAAPQGMVLTGAAAADKLAGGAGDDQLFGLGGNDSLSGGAGSDTLDGGAGADVLDGGTGTDTASYASATSAVVVSLAVTSAQSTGAGKDTLVSIENLTGSSFADKLTGDVGANLLTGGGGNDTITGGGGADALRGGAGSDSFVFKLPDTSVGARDVIYDFSHAEQDRINLSGIDAVAGGKDNAFTLVGGFTHKAGELVCSVAGDHYLVEGDVNGDGAADFAIDVYSQTTLFASDFVL